MKRDDMTHEHRIHVLLNNEIELIGERLEWRPSMLYPEEVGL